MISSRVLLSLLLSISFAHVPLRAQETLAITRQEAISTALSAGTRIALARADTAAARARLLTARALPNPTLSAIYSKAPPTRHVMVDVPLLEALQTRPARAAQATAALRASRLLYSSERIAALVEVDTTYTRALAADARFRLSRQTARDADSLRFFAQRRRDAGDASDLDVDLASVAAGQQLNVAASDSLSTVSTLLLLQTLMGLPADSVQLVLRDSLTLRSPDTLALETDISGNPTLAAALASLDAAERGLALQRRSVLLWPSLTFGVEWGDPDTGNRPLPLIGVGIALPIFNRNNGPIAEAAAERERARATLSVVRLEVRQRLVEGMRERVTLVAQVTRDRDLVIRAQRVASRSLIAYREGASGLPAVLEARRTAREVLSQYIDDLAALLTVNAELRGLTRQEPIP